MYLTLRSENFSGKRAKGATQIAYLQSWLRVLKSDSRMVVTAASAAQKAADYILGKPPRQKAAPVSSTAAFVKPHSIGEPGSRKNSLKIKAPFVLTRMNAQPTSLLIWLWWRRGTRWIVDQELRFNLHETPPPRGVTSL